MPSKGPLRVLSAAELYKEQQKSLPESAPLSKWYRNPAKKEKPHVLACLWIFTPLAASLCLFVVLGALCSPVWLVTVERMPNAAYNGSSPGPNQDEEGEGGAFLVKRTRSSLWVLCATDPGYREYHCAPIEYFPSEEYSPDPNDSTQAIPYAVVRSSVFFFGSGVLLVSGYACCIVGLCHKQRRVCTFVAGALYVVSGLLMLTALIVYISIFKAEVGGKLRPRSSLQPPLFTFRYGPGFLLYVFGFICAEMAGTAAVFLYTNRHAGEVAPCFFNHQPLKYSENNTKINHVAENISDDDQVSDVDYLLIEHALRHPCKKHPPPIVLPPPSPPLPPPPPAMVRHDRRFYFEPLPDFYGSGCSIHRDRPYHYGQHRSLPQHSNHLSTSLHDLGTFCRPPPPPLLYGSARSLLARTQSLPRDASTNTPAFNISPPSPNYDNEEDFYSPGARYGYVTFDLDALGRKTTPV